MCNTGHGGEELLRTQEGRFLHAYVWGNGVPISDLHFCSFFPSLLLPDPRRKVDEPHGAREPQVADP